MLSCHTINTDFDLTLLKKNLAVHSWLRRHILSLFLNVYLDPDCVKIKCEWAQVTLRLLVFYRSFSSVWLKTTCEHWEDWTEGGKPVWRKSKSGHYHCSNGFLQGVTSFTVLIFFFLFLRLKSHPYYPFVWGSEESGIKRCESASTNKH